MKTHKKHIEKVFLPAIKQVIYDIYKENKLLDKIKKDWEPYKLPYQRGTRREEYIDKAATDFDLFPFDIEQGLNAFQQKRLEMKNRRRLKNAKRKEKRKANKKTQRKTNERTEDNV